ncbi:protein of unknown function [Nitrospira japonica]|uniref:Helix-turn-helix domain-containing protein n=1 Tax=Nitrospira japonica TaxID=1325564 RepID=A0A1W1I4B8_9BACT|nr:helix-turn-helix domain-containing protein [Nitrospira japonica]SLM47825.1 protein of unknown function [Nitrospira japonica]
MDAPLLRVHEAAALLKVSKWTVYRWIEEGRLRATKIGRGSLRVFRVSLTALIDENRTDSLSVPAKHRGNVVKLRAVAAKRKK